MTTTIPNIELYSHNEDTFDRICEMWKSTNRVAAIQATGTGKTFLILKCLFDYINENSIVLAPSTYILEQLERKSENYLYKTEFMTYAKLSGMTITEIERLDVKLIVLDEFHRCGAEQWGNGVQNLLKAFPNAKVLGTSATPIRYLDGQRDMSDELFEGNIASNLSLAEAIVKNILPMPKYISALYTFDEETDKLREKIIKCHNDEKSKSELLKKLDKLKSKLDRSKGIPNILKKYIVNNSGKYIVFCKDKVHLYEMKNAVVSWFKKAKIGNKIETYIVLSELSKSNKEFQQFLKSNTGDTIKLLFSVDMLNEGVHAEDIDGVILLRPTVSPIIYYQQIGRAIQVGGSEHPLIFDFVNNFTSIESRTFIEDIKFASQERTMVRNGYGIYDNSLDDLKEFFVIDEVKEVEYLFHSIENHLWDSWDEMFNLLVEYKSRVGNCSVSRDEIVNGKNLGTWVKSQRFYYNKNLLTEDRISKLEKINFCWSPIDEKWECMFGKLVVHLNHHVIQIIDKNSELGRWCNTQRYRYKQHKLDNYRVKKLNSIGFIWDVLEHEWHTMYKLLIEYKSVYGDCNVPLKWQHNCSLGMWVSTQRKCYKNGTLNFHRKELLESIDFEWDQRMVENRKKWIESYELLKKFKDEFGNFNVPKNYLKNGINLYNWIKTQNSAYKNGKLDNTRMKMLLEIGYCF